MNGSTPSWMRLSSEGWNFSWSWGADRLTSPPGHAAPDPGPARAAHAARSRRPSAGDAPGLSRYPLLSRLPENVRPHAGGASLMREEADLSCRFMKDKASFQLKRRPFVMFEEPWKDHHRNLSSFLSLTARHFFGGSQHLDLAFHGKSLFSKAERSPVFRNKTHSFKGPSGSIDHRNVAIGRTRPAPAWHWGWLRERDRTPPRQAA